MRRFGIALGSGAVGAGAFLVAALAALGASSAWADVPTGAAPGDGKLLFDNVCVACHTLGGGARLGPDLQGVTDRRDLNWLRRQIQNPAELRQAGDPIALANRAKYSVPMPTLGLSDLQVDAILDHLRSAGGTPEPVRPALFLPTLGLAAGAAVALTLIGLLAATRRVETT